jgi:predicted NBD/HSP70 family sugar kinase
VEIGGLGSLESLRRLNRWRVIGLLQHEGLASRADIVRRTGLSRATVSSIVADLIADGTVIERADRQRAAPSRDGGRPAIPLMLNPSSGAFAGLDFGHDRLHAVLVDRAGRPLLDLVGKLDVDNEPEAAVAMAQALVLELMAEAQVPRDRLLGVGAAVSAPLRSDGSSAFASPNIFPAWTGFDVGAALETCLGVPVQVGNDANLGALAEFSFGSGRGIPNIVYVMLSAGIGMGLILRGELFTGEAGTAGELGHVVVDPVGRVCRCGNRGCLETVAGAGPLTDALSYVHGPDLDTERMLELAAAEDAGVLRLLGDAGRSIGRVLSGICSVLDPGVVIVGGTVGQAGAPLLDGIREAIDRETPPVSGHSYPVVQGALGHRAEAFGAAALAMDADARQMLVERALGDAA